MLSSELNDNRELFNYNGFTPTESDDCWYDYETGINTFSNLLSSLSNTPLDNSLAPRGSHVLDRFGARTFLC